MTITKQQLLDAGYQEHKGTYEGDLLQKIFYDGTVKLFFLNFFFHPDLSLPNSVTIDVRLYPKSGLHGVNGLTLKASVGEDTAPLEEIEASFLHLYKALDCQPDPHNN